MVVLERKLTHVSFALLCNVVVRNAIVHVPEGKVVCFRFPSWCDVFDVNVVVPIGKLRRIRFH